MLSRLTSSNILTLVAESAWCKASKSPQRPEVIRHIAPCARSSLAFTSDRMLLLLFHKQQTPTSGSALLLFVRCLSNALVDGMMMLLDHATTAPIMMVMLTNNTDIIGRTADANTVTVWFMNRRKRDRKSVSCVSGTNPLTSKVEILK